jgi:two-component system sensor histidine kinase KdpD
MRAHHRGFDRGGQADGYLALNVLLDGGIQGRSLRGRGRRGPGDEAVHQNRAGQHEIGIDIPKELMMIPMDGTLIEQVLVNLLDNAIKHTPAGSSIALTVLKEGSRAVFEVSDNGNGIPENDLPFIFDRYFTRPSGSARRHSIGIGLSICKSIVETHGGIITAQNNTSGGAIFRFTLPMEE